MSDIILIYPKHTEESGATMGTPLTAPLGLAFLSSILQKNGFSVEIIDNSLEKLPLGNILKRVDGALMVGLSCMATNYSESLAIAQNVKNLRNIPIVIGGPNATICPTMYQKPFIDYICMGEGEQTLLELCQSLRSKTTPSRIKGLMYKDGESWKSNDRRELIKSLDDLPHPSRNLFSISHYLNKTVEIDAFPILSMNTSRGCPFSCTFCSVKGVWGRTYRTFSIEWILDEISILINKYGANGIYFYEDNFTHISSRVEAICEGILSRNYKIKWACEGRIGSLSLPLLKKMKLAGCQTVKFGVESGSPRMLELIDKDISIDAVKETRNLCRQASLRFACFLLIGIPSETDEDRLLTLKLAEELKPDIPILNVYIPFPGSFMYDQMKTSKSYDHIGDNGVLYRTPSEQNMLQDWSNRLIFASH